MIELTIKETQLLLSVLKGVLSDESYDNYVANFVKNISKKSVKK